MGRRHRLERSTILHGSLDEVFAFFAQPQNLARITPPSLGFRIVEGPDRPLRRGDVIRYRIRVAGIPLGWTTIITEWEPPRRFADFQESGPYRHWNHLHEFRDRGDGTVEMTDTVDYELPFGPLGALAHAVAVRRQLRGIFDYRGEVIADLFPSGGQLETDD